MGKSRSRSKLQRLIRDCSISVRKLPSSELLFIRRARFAAADFRARASRKSRIAGILPIWKRAITIGLVVENRPLFDPPPPLGLQAGRLSTTLVVGTPEGRLGASWMRKAGGLFPGDGEGDVSPIKLGDREMQSRKKGRVSESAEFSRE